MKVYELIGLKHPVEIKSAATIHADFFKELSYFNNLSGSANENSTLIYGGNENHTQFDINVIGWRNADTYITKIIT